MNRKPFCLNLLIASILLTVNLSFAQRPGRVVSIVKEDHNFEYYRSMAEQWKKVVDKDKTDADAWFNYYYANRYARMFREDYEKNPANYFEKGEEIVKSIEKSIPGTYEYYFIKASEIHDETLLKDNCIRKAYEMKPGNPLTYPLLVTQDEITGRTADKAEICKKWYNCNDMSPALLNYNYNVLISLPDTAILFTMGDNDTYPLWLLQEAKGIKPGVKVLNIALFYYSDEYRERVLKELNIPKFETPSKMDGYPEDNNDPLDQVFFHVITKSHQPVYLANSLVSSYYEGLNIEKDLYQTGLTILYSKKSIDNLAIIRNNYEHIFLLDYLRQGFINDPSARVAAYLNLNYEPMLLKLYEHFKLSGEQSKAEEVKGLGIYLAKQVDMEKAYTDMFSGK
jgi:hypothetical protein